MRGAPRAQAYGAGLNLAVAPGLFYGFVGPNGAGMTTAVRMLATLLPPTVGEVSVAGYELRREPHRVRERFGYVGQSGGTDHSVSGRAALVIQARLFGLSAQDAQRWAGEPLAAFELDTCADRPSGTYSSGQRRRLTLPC